MKEKRALVPGSFAQAGFALAAMAVRIRFPIILVFCIVFSSVAQQRPAAGPTDAVAGHSNHHPLRRRGLNRSKHNMTFRIFSMLQMLSHRLR
jgi:hypothetical protein